MAARLSTLGMVAFGLAALILPYSDALAGQCVPDHRPVQLNSAETVRLREYFCRRDNGREVVRVQFHRLSSMAASLLLNRTNVFWNSALFGSYQLIENAPAREFKQMLSRFGYTNLSSDYAGESVLAFGIDTPAGGTGTDGTKDIENESFRFQDLPISSEMPMPEEMAARLL